MTLISVVIASYANYKVQRWRYRSDRLDNAINTLCSVINEAADQATEYWLLDCSSPEMAAKAYAAEFVIVGRQSRIQQLIFAVGVLDLKFMVPSLNQLVDDLFDAMTAGDFQVAGRAPDLVRAAKVQSVAAQMNGALREAVGVRIS